MRRTDLVKLGKGGDSSRVEEVLSAAVRGRRERQVISPVLRREVGEPTHETTDQQSLHTLTP